MLSRVHEYAILYSNRVSQRDKRWNDGILKFYELNRKIEVYNDDEMIITTDFLNTRDVVIILQNTLADGNQLKIAAHSFLVEVLSKKGVHERDVLLNSKVDSKRLNEHNTSLRDQKMSQKRASLSTSAAISADCKTKDQERDRIGSASKARKGSAHYKAVTGSIQAIPSHQEGNPHYKKVMVSRLCVRFTPKRVEKGSHRQRISERMR